MLRLIVLAAATHAASRHLADVRRRSLEIGADVERVDPRYAVNLTLYHVNPLKEGVEPVNMDTSDLPGDIFFDLRSVVLPVECASPYAWPGDCENQEMVGDDLVISKLLVEADARWGEYGMCNVCGADGRDPFSHMRCTPNEYFCTCRNKIGYGLEPCPDSVTSKVGRENITETFSEYQQCTWDQFMKTPWQCWSSSVFRKTGGMWYSTFEEGEGTAWKVLEVQKVVNKSCSDDVIYSAIEAYDDVSCFDACSRQRNTSSACWVGCFYRTVLGADGMLPSGFDNPGGMPYEALADAWDRPFASDAPARGGCPAVPV